MHACMCVCMHVCMHYQAFSVFLSVERLWMPRIPQPFPESTEYTTNTRLGATTWSKIPVLLVLLLLVLILLLLINYLYLLS